MWDLPIRPSCFCVWYHQQVAYRVVPDMKPTAAVRNARIDSNQRSLQPARPPSTCSDPDRVVMLRRSRSTHWKQTVVYLEDTITICQGEVITGQFRFQAKDPCGCTGQDGRM